MLKRYFQFPTRLVPRSGLINMFTRLVPRSGIIAGLILLTLVITYALLTLLSVPSAPKLKSGSGDSLFIASNSIYSSAIGTRDGQAKVSFSVRDSEASFVLAGIDKVTPQKESSNSVLFPSVQPDTDLRYTTTPNGLKEEIILRSAPKSNVYLFDFLLNNVTPKKLTNDFIDPSFQDDKGTYLFHFDKPFAVDANGNRTNNVLLQIGEDKQLSKRYYLKLIVDQAWLSDPARVYPIVIDPTILHDTTAEFVAGTLNRLKDTGPGATATLESYYQELPTDQYTVGLWHLNEASGNALDSSGNGNTGTPTGTTVVAGKISNARSFPGSAGNHIRVSSFTAINKTNGQEITVEAWIKPNWSSGYQGIVVNRTDAAYNWMLYQHTTDGSIQFHGAAQNKSTYIPPNNVWTHIAATVNSSGVYTLYVNGEVKQTVTGYTYNAQSPSELSIGDFGSNNEPWNGQIDEVRISNIARTPEEIKSSASRRPYSIYTSDVLDLGGAGSFVTIWNPLQWSEHGVNTGDGETLKSSTNLVAQWNFNETSGTVADNAEGTAALDGTLTGFASTASQDQAAGTGWTSANRRWGAGALMFDGASDYVQLSNAGGQLTFGTGEFTIEAWVNAKSLVTNSGIFYSQSSNSSGFYGLGYNTTNGFFITFYNGSTRPTTYHQNKSINLGAWYHVVGQRKANNDLVIYVNGIPSITNDNSSLSLTAGDPRIGVNPATFGEIWNGVIDSTRIYSRALGAAEIMSNYQVGNIEFQTRVGADTSPDDGSWEAWKPITGETAIASMDSDVSNWNPIGTQANPGTSCSDILVKNRNATSGNYYIQPQGSSSSFQVICDMTTDGGGWTLVMNHPLTTGISATSGWVSGNQVGATADFTNTALKWKLSDAMINTMKSYGYKGTGTFASCIGGACSGSTTFYWKGTCNLNITAAATGACAQTYSDYTLNTSLGTTDAGSSHRGLCANVYATSKYGGCVGHDGDYIWTGPFTTDGRHAYTGRAGEQSGWQVWVKDQVADKLVTLSNESTVKIEGTGSLKAQTGRPTIDGNTVALWHLDETGGTGAYIKDSTANANHGTPTGTTTINGISGKGRSFNGSSDLITIPNSTNYNFSSGDFAIETWAKFSANTGYRMIVDRRGSSDQQGWILYLETANNYIQFLTATSTGWDKVLSSSIQPVLNNWYHIVATRVGNTMSLYVNGALTSSVDVTGYTIGNQTTNMGIGYNASGATPAGYFNGILDEIRISKGAGRTAEEVAESYRSGRDHYINKTISSTDLSGKSSLPFYVAADRPGSYLSATIGESAFANYQPDANTVGLWHLAEQSGSGAYIKDSSSIGNHGTPTGTTFTQGKIGKARNLNGSSDYITVNQTLSTPITISGWIKMDDFTKTLNTFINSYPHPVIGISPNRTGIGDIYVYIGNGTSWTGAPGIISSVNMTQSKWQHLAFTSDGSISKLYLDGALVGTSPYVPSGWGSYFRFGAIVQGGEYLKGSLDEMRIDNTARTADEIRQAYEVGLRTHPITIDFGAKLDSGNLITGSGDLGFTVDATYYGLQNKGDMLFKGDKVIVRENYDGTEYIAQGTVDAITASTGATTVSAWDSGSTFPSGGYTVNASVFKWQREYWNPSASLGTHRNAITNLSLRLTDGAEGRTIWLDDLRSNGDYLTAGSGSTITSSTGSRYMQYRSILSSFDEAVSATLSAVTVDYVINTTPATPSLDAPTDTATNQILSTVLKTTSTDTDSDYLRYKIELCTNLAMTTGCQTFDQTSSQTGWSGQNAQTSTAYTSGTQATYTLQTPLTITSTYYWRSYVKDPGGTDTWSGTQTPYSFTTTTAPTAPTVPYVEGASNPTGIIDLTPEFSAIHNDPNGDAANYYEIEVNTDNTFTGTVMWDSNQTAMTSTADGVRSPDLSYAGTALSYNGSTYYWRIRFTDVGGAVGAWSATQNFSTNIKPGVPSLDSPSDTGLNQSLSPALKTTATDTNSDYLRYKIQLCTDLAMTLNCQTFDQTVSQTGWTGQNAQTSTAYTSGTQGTYTLTANLSPSTIYYWRSYAIDPGGTDTWSTTQTPYSFVTRKINEGFSCLINETADDSSLTIVWIDNEAQEDSYKLERNVDSGGFSAFQTLAANAVSYQDTSITTGHTYQYRVAPYINATSSYGAWCTTSTLSLAQGNFSFENIIFR